MLNNDETRHDLHKTWMNLKQDCDKKKVIACDFKWYVNNFLMSFNIMRFANDEVYLETEHICYQRWHILTTI
jgi:hypothetical protein